MSPKRGERVAPPAAGGGWEVKYGHKDACSGWDDLCQQAPEKTAWAWEEMRYNPGPIPPTNRHHRLKGNFSTATLYDGRELPLWQIEVTSKGRAWYLLDVEKHTVWLIYASTKHPKVTE